VDPEPPMIVPGSMSPAGNIFSNQNHLSMSIEFNKQVNYSIDQRFRASIINNKYMIVESSAELIYSNNHKHTYI
jgi:hypothetical protein